MELVRTLLDATAQVLTDVGLDRLSTNKVAKHAQVAVGSIYQYFPNKEALIDALVEDRMSRLVDLVRARMAALDSHSFESAAEVMLRAVTDFFRAEPGLVPVMMSRTLTAPDKGIARELRSEGIALAHDFLKRLADGTLPDLDVAVFISTNVAGLLGALLADPAIDDDFRERATSEAVRMLSIWMTPSDH
jgi:AcrR family transcriptional regulator